MIDVLLLCFQDHSNTAWRLLKCLESLGLSVLLLKGEASPYRYLEQGVVSKHIRGDYITDIPIICAASELRPLAEKAKVIHYTASSFIWTGADLSKKKVVVSHGGTVYRQYPETLNALFNQFVDFTIVQMTDLMGLGAKNEVFIANFGDTDYLQPDYSPKGKGKLVIGHFPSNPENKGTDVILSVIKRLEADPALRDRFIYVGTRNTAHRREAWAVQIGKMRQCDTIIETVLPLQGVKPLGTFSNHAVEIGAIGAVIVTNFTDPTAYEREYGRLGFQPVNNGEELEARLRTLIGMTPAQIENEKRRCRAWVEQYHSIDATARRLWDKVYRHLL